MKKFLSLFLALNLCLLSMPLIASAQGTVDIDSSISVSTTLACKEKLIVKFTKPESLNGVMGFQFKLIMPEGFTIKSHDQLLGSQWESYYNVETNRFIIYSSSLSRLEENRTYDLLELELDKSTSVVNGSYDVNIRVEDITTENFTSNKGTEFTVSTFKYTEHNFENGECTVCGELKEHTVTFQDKMGNVIHTTTVKDGQKLTIEDITVATSLVPEIFGYKKAIDESGVQTWLGDVTAAIYGDTDFTALYNKDETRYTVTVNYTSGLVRSYTYRFNEKFIIPDELANYWVNEEGVIVAKATDGKANYYVSGDAELFARQDEAAEEMSLAFVRGVTGTQDGKRTYTVFSHFNNPDGIKVKSYGVTFLSNTKYEQLSDVNADWASQFEEGTVPTYKLTNKMTNDFMVTLTNISPTAKVMRWAQAYVEFEDGSKMYSAPISQLFEAQ